MADIGAASGIVGSGVYRHFDSKSAVLLALLDEGMERLLGRRRGSGRLRPAAIAEVLDELIRGQVLFAVDDALLVRLWLREVQTLPTVDQRRLRRMQRHYLEEWVHTLRRAPAGVVRRRRPRPRARRDRRDPVGGHLERRRPARGPRRVAQRVRPAMPDRLTTWRSGDGAGTRT